MSWRTLRVLIQHLPPESATMTALRLAATPEERAVEREKPGDPEAGRWSQLEMLVAQAVDVLRAQHHSFLKVNGAKRLTPPEPTPRPGVAPLKKTAVLSEAGAETLFRLINGPPPETR